MVTTTASQPTWRSGTGSGSGARRRRHVLVLTTHFPSSVEPLDGAPIARSLEALAASPRGWDVTCIHALGIPLLALGRYRDLAQLDDFAAVQGVALHRARYTLLPTLHERRAPSAIANAALPLARRLHAERPFDCIAGDGLYPQGLAAAWIADALDLPLTLTARGKDIFHWASRDFARDRMLEAGATTGGLCAGSVALIRECAALGLPRERITLLAPGIDRDRFRPLDHTQLRHQLGNAIGFVLPDHAPMLICAASLEERNGQEIAIAALAQVEGARLVLAGEGPDMHSLRELARDLGLAERVHFAGRLDLDTLPVVLSAADAMVLPVHSLETEEAWIEALACGTPVITCDTGAAREVIRDDTAGRLVARDPDSVAAGINAVLNAPPPSHEVAACASSYSWELHADIFAAHLAEIADQAR